MKYPIGIQTFEKLIEGGFVYVDKTDLVYKLVTEGNIYFLSRPRRFGKSLLVSTCKSYFQGKKELFKGLKIDALEKEWNEYPVFHIDFNQGKFTNPTELKIVIDEFIAENEKRFGIEKDSDVTGKRFANILKTAHEQTGRKAVVLIDEYDKPLLDVMETSIPAPETVEGIKTLEEYNRNLLKGFYSVFKAADADLQFVLLTGVTKFSQVSIFSGFNQPKDLGKDPRYDALCGITTDELLSYFDEPIRTLATKNKVSYEVMVATLKKHYDGYHFSEEMVDIYNPFSIINCLDSQKISDYWFASGTPEYLMRLMAASNVNINELTGKYYDAREFVDFKADSQQPLPMLYQSGYLTIKEYDNLFNTYKLDYPNKEVRSGMISLLAARYFKDDNSMTSLVMTLSRALMQGKIEEFTKEITALLASISYRFREVGGKDMEYERHFQYSFYLIMRLVGQFNVLVEKETSQGRIDCVLECPEHIYIFEFKRDGNVDEALKQIDDKGYAKPYLTDPRPLYKVGMNFSTATGTVEEMKYELIEK